MGSGKSTFKETDVRKAIKAVQAAGLEVIAVVIGNGVIDVRTGGKEKHDDEFSNDEILKRLRSNDDSKS
jgi:hypothetical protein